MANIVQRVLTYSSSILPKVNLHNHSAVTKTRNYKLYSDFTSVLTNAFLLFHDIRM